MVSAFFYIEVIDMKVRTIEYFKDVTIGKHREVNDVFEVTEKRAKVLLGDNEYKRAFVEVIKEDKPKEEKAEKEDKK